MTMLPAWQRGTGPGARMPRRGFRSLYGRRLICAYLNFPIRRRVRAIQIQLVQRGMFIIRNRGTLFRTSTISRPASPELEGSGIKSGYLRSFDSEAQALGFARSWAERWCDTH